MEELDKLFEEIKPDLEKRVEARFRSHKNGEKFCNSCQQWKSLDEFHNRKDRGSSDRFGKVSKCKPCSLAAYRAWYEKNLEYVRKKGRESAYLSRHKDRLTSEEAKGLAENNVGYCDICSSYEVIYVDHCHKTGQRRGFLCNSCNLAIGKFKDSVELLQRAASYLLRYKHG